MSFDLSAQVAIVTGASSGLGVAFARTLAQAGARVAIVARRREKLDALVSKIQEAGGVAMAVEADMAEADHFAPMLDQIEAQLGRVSILVNNAGTADGYRALDLPMEALDHVWAVNLRGPWALSCEVARRLVVAGEPGRIVNISSIGAFNYDARTSAAAFYSVTKAAVVRMTEVLAMEWARHHINVNAIAPGIFVSEMSEAHMEKLMERTVSKTPRGRIGQPERLESTLLYLVSPESELVTGTCIKVDDGQMPR